MIGINSEYEKQEHCRTKQRNGKTSGDTNNTGYETSSTRCTTCIENLVKQTACPSLGLLNYAEEVNLVSRISIHVGRVAKGWGRTEGYRGKGAQCHAWHGPYILHVQPPTQRLGPWIPRCRAYTYFRTACIITSDCDIDAISGVAGAETEVFGTVSYSNHDRIPYCSCNALLSPAVTLFDSHLLCINTSCVHLKSKRDGKIEGMPVGL